MPSKDSPQMSTTPDRKSRPVPTPATVAPKAAPTIKEKPVNEAKPMTRPKQQKRDNLNVNVEEGRRSFMSGVIVNDPRARPQRMQGSRLKAAELGPLVGRYVDEREIKSNCKLPDNIHEPVRPPPIYVP